MLSLLDKALNCFYRWVKETVAPRALKLKALQVTAGICMAVPLLLFPLMAVGIGLHWWSGSDQVAAALLMVMTIAAVIDAIFYAVIAVVMFLSLWCRKLTLPERKQARMKVTFVCAPFLYGLTAAWGIAILHGRPGGIFVRPIIAVYALCSAANLVVTFADRRKSLAGTV